ncbi:MAG: hypothetical protein ACRDLV_07010 [Solirubrobacteraceae bacterium]
MTGTDRRAPTESGRLGRMAGVRIPVQLAAAVAEDRAPGRHSWLASLPARVRDLASEWELELGEPYEPGGQCAWVAPRARRHTMTI